MSSETKPLLKNSSNEYNISTSGGNRAVIWTRLQNAENLFKQSWARAVKVGRMREFFAEFLATFALVVCILISARR